MDSGRLLRREGAGGAGREDDVWLETDKLLREDRMTFLLSLRPLVPDDEILSLHVAELTETLPKGVDQVGFEGWRRVAQIPNRHGASGLLCRGGQRRREQAKGAKDEADSGSGTHGNLHIVLPAGLWLTPSAVGCNLGLPASGDLTSAVHCWPRLCLLFDGASARSARFGNLTVLLAAPPETPTAPITLPSTMIGTPPSIEMAR